MRSSRFFPKTDYHAPYYPYQQPFRPNGFPPHYHMNQQPYPPSYMNMPFQQGAWQPPYQGMGTEQKSLTKSVMGYFQNSEGQLDFDKVFNTAGQVANTYQQFSPIVKGIGSFIKGD
ncbi:YppG family protein [Amphibacillus sp. MSJ-3]|uniref:YppG family protein n=1 Tax=Amphibacillus sp. MSJ-3 TaxID=2841505 RepID=UPI001C0F2BE8|nr:YppG family protein [Amphibacillus sp. MSJ-3]MBU5595410.1 YppG family protein [Amphibacillus sp. MSJ-3]